MATLTSNANITLSGNIIDTGALAIQTGSNGNISLEPNGTGVVVVTKDLVTNANLTTGPQKSILFFDGDSSHYVGFRGPSAVTANVSWTLPSTDGTSGQVLSTDGLGLLSWATGGGGSGGGGYFNSTLTSFPGSTANVDYGDGETFVGQAATVDAFGIGIVAVFSCMDPLGSLQSADLGAL